MTRREALAIARLWKSWAAGRTINNRTYREFVLDVVGIDPGLQRLSVFEILDAAVNGEAWEIGGAADASGRGTTRGTGASDTTENGPGGQSRTTRVVEVEKSAH